MKAKCGTCEKVFDIRPARVKNARFVYCSQKCHFQGMRNRVTIHCEVCGKKVTRTPAQMKNSKSGKFFCNKSCQTKWRNRKFVGEKHANWKHGEGINYRSILSNSGKEEKCNLCGAVDKRVLAVHHKDSNRSNNKLENLVWLCHNCHHLVHHHEVEV